MNGTDGAAQKGQCLNSADEPRGLITELLSLFGSLGSHLQALTALAGEEAHEAAGLYLRIAIFLAATLFFAVFGYVLSLFFIAFLAAMIFKYDWIYILLFLAIIHIVISIICAICVKIYWRIPVFISTKEEIARDMKALREKPLS